VEDLTAVKQDTLPAHTPQAAGTELKWTADFFSIVPSHVAQDELEHQRFSFL
jgi:hypothetical protein